MPEQVDVVLIKPGGQKKTYAALSSSLAAIEPPLWIGMAAAFVRENGFSVRLIDAEAENLSPDEAVAEALRLRPVLAAVGAIGANPSASSTPIMPAAGELLSKLKAGNPKLSTAIFGIHPSGLPEKTLNEESADFVLRGEVFYSLTELLRALKSGENDFNIEGLWYKKDGQVVGNGWGKLVKDLDMMPFAAWDLLPMERYRAHNWHCFSHVNERSPYAVIYTSLGCPFHCSFCNISALYDGKPGIRFRSPQRVVEEIDLLHSKYGVKNIKMLDELFLLKEDRALELCDLLIERDYGLNIWAYARVDTVNERALSKMKQAGIHWLAFGIESASSRVRTGVVKGRYDDQAIRQAVKMTHDAGINIVANFIFGLPEDDLDTMRESLDLAKELNCAYANFYTAMAYPGSKLYEEACEQKLQLPQSWLGYSQFGEDTYPLPTKYISSAQVLKFRDLAFIEYHSSPAYLEMMGQKFGTQAVEHIKDMLKVKLRRKLLEYK